MSVLEPLAPSSHRRALLKATAELVVERGVEAIVVGDILERSGVSRRTFYKFFAGKEAALLGLYSSSAAILLESLSAALQTPGEPQDKIGACIDAYLQVNDEAGALMRALTAEAMRPGSTLETSRIVFFEALSDVVLEELGLSDAERLLAQSALMAVEGVLRLVTATAPLTRAQKRQGRETMVRLLSVVL